MTMRPHVRYGMALLLCLLLPAGGQVLAAAPHAYEAVSSGYFRDRDTLPPSDAEQSSGEPTEKPK